MSTMRKIVKENATGLKNTSKKRLILTLSIVTINYFSEGDKLSISIKGKNIKENDYLQIGQFHTFMVELNQKVTIFK
jgi:protein pelota